MPMRTTRRQAKGSNRRPRDTGHQEKIDQARKEKVAFTTEEHALVAFKDFGGSPAFLKYLKGALFSSHTRGFPLDQKWKASSLKEISTLARKLRVALEKSDFPFLYGGALGRGPGRFGMMLELELFNPIIKKIWGTGKITFPDKETFCKLLRQLECETSIFNSDFGKTFLLMPKEAGGRSPKWNQAFRWLGALVPYTAALNPKMEPQWDWIQGWLALKDQDAPDAEKIWRETIRKPKGRCVDPNLERAVVDASLHFLRYRRLFSSGDWANKRWDATEKRFLSAAISTMPLISRKFNGCRSLGELLARTRPILPVGVIKQMQTKLGL